MSTNIREKYQNLYTLFHKQSNDSFHTRITSRSWQQYTDQLTDINLTSIGPCIANIFTQYNHQDATFLNLFISVRRSTCFRRVFRPASGAQNCTYRFRYLSHHYCYLLLASGAQNCTYSVRYLSHHYCYLLLASGAQNCTYSQVFVTPLLLPAASLRSSKLHIQSGICHTITANCC